MAGELKVAAGGRAPGESAPIPLPCHLPFHRLPGRRRHRVRFCQMSQASRGTRGTSALPMSRADVTKVTTGISFQMFMMILAWSPAKAG